MGATSGTYDISLAHILAQSLPPTVEPGPLADAVPPQQHASPFGTGDVIVAINR